MTEEARRKKLTGEGYKSFDSMESQSSSSSSRIQMKTTRGEEAESGTERSDQPTEEGCLFFIVRYLKNCFKAREKHKKEMRSTSSSGSYESLPQQDDPEDDDNDWWTAFYSSLERKRGAVDSDPGKKLHNFRVCAFYILTVLFDHFLDSPQHINIFSNVS
ncbi:hypothetical protein JTB14_019733 [Gonioctena quinquepunctata]|nr:hypothetical protein JTB14_019733 [Gonioctena quinquepunctata]